MPKKEVIRIPPLLTHHSLSFELFRFFSVQYQTHLHVHQAHLKFQSEYRIKRNSCEMRCLSCPNWQQEIVVKCVACHATNAQIGSKRRKGQAIAGRNLEGALAFACHSEVVYIMSSVLYWRHGTLLKIL